MEKAYSQTEEISGSNSTSMGNQTGTALTSNQSTLAESSLESTGNQAGALANLTMADFDPMKTSLFTARGELMNKNLQSAYNAVNAAGSELFRVEQGVARSDALSQQLRPLANQIDLAHDAIQNNNSSEALRHLNSADNQLLKITENLPPATVSGGGETDEEED
jgi:hypothetical protein